MDGIEYQHNANNSAFKPIVDFYDIGNDPYAVARYYSSAIQSGADMIIGPLGKDYANQLTSYTLQSGDRPIILLGGDTYLDSQRLGNITRLTMSPERDGITVADRAQSLGFVTVALLVPNNQTAG